MTVGLAESECALAQMIHYIVCYSNFCTQDDLLLHLRGIGCEYQANEHGLMESILSDRDK